MSDGRNFTPKHLAILDWFRAKDEEQPNMFHSMARCEKEIVIDGKRLAVAEEIAELCTVPNNGTDPFLDVARTGKHFRITPRGVEATEVYTVATRKLERGGAVQIIVLRDTGKPPRSSPRAAPEIDNYDEAEEPIRGDSLRGEGRRTRARGNVDDRGGFDDVVVRDRDTDGEEVRDMSSRRAAARPAPRRQAEEDDREPVRRTGSQRPARQAEGGRVRETSDRYADGVEFVPDAPQGDSGDDQDDDGQDVEVLGEDEFDQADDAPPARIPPRKDPKPSKPAPASTARQRGPGGQFKPRTSTSAGRARPRTRER